MWMPSVVDLALAPVRDLQRPDLSDDSHLGKYRPGRPVLKQIFQSEPLFGKQVFQIIGALMWRRERQQIDPTTRRFMRSHRRHNFNPASFRNFCGTHRTGPNRAASLQP